MTVELLNDSGEKIDEIEVDICPHQHDRIKIKETCYEIQFVVYQYNLDTKNYKPLLVVEEF